MNSAGTSRSGVDPEGGHDTLIDRVISAWLAPPGDENEALATFGSLYTDPVTVNGAHLRLADLVQRARELNEALIDVQIEVLDAVEVGDRATFVLRHTGRHVGDLRTPAGELAATGQRLEAIGIDVFTITDGKISSIWVVNDEFGRLARIGAVELVRAG